MPKPRKVDRLPEDVRKQLDAKLITNAFSDYEGLSKWLKSIGYEISRSSLQEHGQAFKQKLEAVKLATDQAKAIAEANPDREGAMNDALMRLIQQRLFDVLVEMEGETSPRALNAICLAVARSVRASIPQKKWMEEMRAKLDSSKTAAAGKVREIASEGGLSKEAADRIRDVLMGINV